jgi:hypothetical protein
MDITNYEKAISKIQDSTIFLLKADALALTGMITLISAFKLEPVQALGVAGSNTWVIITIVALIILMLLFHAILTVITPGKVAINNQKAINIFQKSYLILTLFHFLTLSYATGFIVGSLHALQH